MKKTIALLAAFILLAALAVPGVWAKTSINGDLNLGVFNFIVNGGFDALRLPNPGYISGEEVAPLDRLAGWDATNASGGLTADGYNDYGYRLDSGTLRYTVDLFPVFDINTFNQKDTTYSFSVMARPNGSSSSVSLAVKAFLEINREVDIEVTEIDGFDPARDEWQSVSVKFTSRETYDDEKWYLLILEISGCAILDSAAVNYCDVESDPSKDCIFTESVTGNTDMDGEEGFGGSDYPLIVESPQGCYSLDTSVSFSGGASIKYTNDEPGVINDIYLRIPLEDLANDIYYVSMKVRGKGIHADMEGGLLGFFPRCGYLMSDGNLYPEVINYLDWERYGGEYGYYRAFVNASYASNGGYLYNGYLIPGGYYPNGTIGHTAEPTDVEWTTITICFNPWAMPSLVEDYHSGVEYEFDTDGFAVLRLLLNYMHGEFWLDDIKMWRSGTPEPDFSTDYEIEFNGTDDRTQIPFGSAFTFPDVVFKVEGEDGALKPVDATVRVAIERNDGAFGYGTILEETDNTEAARTFTPDEHGFYRMVYKITAGERTATTYYNIEVVDTCTGLKLDTSKVYTEIAKGETLDLGDLIVYAIYSLSAPDGRIVENFTISTDYTPQSDLGVYPVTVKYVDPFAGEVSASFNIEVKETVDRPTPTPTPVPTPTPTPAPATQAPTDAPTDAPTNAPTDAPAQNGGFPWLWIVIAAVVVVAVVVVVVVLGKKKK
ncbi:MAG: hypothetical protein KIG36_05410 [Eubacteriales bacterium]|nr:hypothetical protein [Eubacteriales bacterium]